MLLEGPKCLAVRVLGMWFHRPAMQQSAVAPYPDDAGSLAALRSPTLWTVIAANLAHTMMACCLLQAPRANFTVALPRRMPHWLPTL